MWHILDKKQPIVLQISLNRRLHFEVFTHSRNLTNLKPSCISKHRPCGMCRSISALSQDSFNGFRLVVILSFILQSGKFNCQLSDWRPSCSFKYFVSFDVAWEASGTQQNTRPESWAQGSSAASNFKVPSCSNFISFGSPICNLDKIFFSARPSLGVRQSLNGKWGGGYLPAQASRLRIHFCGWVASIFWNKWVHWRLRSNIHSTRPTSGVGALRKSIRVSTHVVQSLAACDHFLETLSVLGHQILLSSRKI